MVKVQLNERGREYKFITSGIEYHISHAGIEPKLPTSLALTLIGNKELDFTFEAKDKEAIEGLNSNYLQTYYNRYSSHDTKDLLEKLFPTKSTRQKVQKVVEDVVSTPVKKTPAKKTAKKGGKK
jgi:hypothetical protein